MRKITIELRFDSEINLWAVRSSKGLYAYYSTLEEAYRSMHLLYAGEEAILDFVHVFEFSELDTDDDERKDEGLQADLDSLIRVALTRPEHVLADYIKANYSKQYEEYSAG